MNPIPKKGCKQASRQPGRFRARRYGPTSAAAIDYLDAQPFVRAGKIATIGFCFGGSVAFVTATLPGLVAAIPFYGGSIAADFPNGEPQASPTRPTFACRSCSSSAAKTTTSPAEAVRRIDEALDAAEKPHEIVVYPNVGHAFFRESSAALAQHEVSDAWQRVRAFLAEHTA